MPKSANLKKESVKEVTPRSECEALDLYVNDPKSIVALMDCDEPLVNLQGLDGVSHYAEIKPDVIPQFINEGLVEVIIKLMKSEIDAIVGASLKLLSKIMNYDGVKSKAVEEIDYILNLYSERLDDEVQEWSSACLLHLSVDKDLKKIYLPYLNSIILKISLRDPDVQCNTLLLMKNLISGDKNVVKALTKITEFSTQGIMKLFWSEYVQIQNAALDVIKELSEISKFDDMLLKENVLKNLEKILKACQFEDLHEKAVLIIKNLVTKDNFVEAVKELIPSFFKYLNDIIDDRIMIAALETIFQMSKLFHYKRVLQENGVIKKLNDLMEDCSDNYKAKIIQSLALLMTEVKVEEDMNELGLTDYVMKLTVEPSNLQCVALNTLFEMVKLSPKLLRKFLNDYGVTTLINLLTNESYHHENVDSIRKSIYTVLLIQCLLWDTYIWDSTLTKELMSVLIYALQRYPICCYKKQWRKECIRLTVIVLEALSSGVEMEEWREWFVECDGPREILKLMMSGPDEVLQASSNLIKKIVLLDEEVALTFVKNEALNWMINRGNKENELGGAVDAILSQCLFAKLAVRGKLESHEKIPDKGFYVMREPKAKFLSQLANQLLSKDTQWGNIYTVSFNYTLINELGKNFLDDYSNTICKENCILKKSLTSSINSSDSSKIISSESFEIPDDPFLPQYIIHLRNILNIKDDMDLPIDENDQKFRIEAIAKFVNDRMSGTTGLPCMNHVINLHLAQIKVNLSCPLIPLGYVRVGMKLERALLFKVLADRLSVPCSLVFSSKGLTIPTAWVEVVHPLPIYPLPPLFSPTHVVDLMFEPGSLIPAGSLEAEKYSGRPVPPKLYHHGKTIYDATPSYMG